MPPIRPQAIAIALAVGFVPHLAGSGPVAEPALLTAQYQADFEQRKRIAAGAIRELVARSKLAEMDAEFRRSLREVIMPALKEVASGQLPGAAELDSQAFDEIARLLTFFEYLNQASSAFSAAVAQHADEMIDEAADILARHATFRELEYLKRASQLGALQKGFESLHAASRLITGFSLMDARAITLFENWAKGLDRNAFSLLFPEPGSPRGQPTPEKMAKAQNLVADAVRISRIEEAIERCLSFMRDVYLPATPLDAKERKEVIAGIEALEFSYGIQKALVLSVGPVILANAMTDEQLDVIHAFVKAPTFEKAAKLWIDFVRTATSFTVQDIEEAQRLREDIDAAMERRSEAERHAENKAWDAYVERWSSRLTEAVPPEVREGLDRSWKALRREGAPL